MRVGRVGLSPQVGPPSFIYTINVSPYWTTSYEESGGRFFDNFNYAIMYKSLFDKGLHIFSNGQMTEKTI